MGLETESIAFFCSTAAVLGLSGGMLPGPLMALVISQAIRFGFKEGAVVAMAPLVTDGPLVLLSVLLLSEAAAFDGVLGVLSLLGGVFLFYLAWDSASAGDLKVEETVAEAPRSMRKSVIANLLNPHAYLFWFVLGGPLVVRAGDAGGASPWLFIAIFFGCLVGSKVAIAWLIARYRHLLTNSAYRWVMRGLGVGLGVCAILFWVDGVEKLI
jgi:threonine/homoserine/homoserine lactone efflux protein